MYTIVSCMSYLKVQHFVEAMQHSVEQCDACRDKSCCISGRLIELYQSNLQQQSWCGTKQPSASGACLVINGSHPPSHTHTHTECVFPGQCIAVSSA